MSNDNQNVTHYHPGALLFFVPAFSGEVVKPVIVDVNEVTSAEYTQQTKEISNIHLSLTVRNNPGTFTVTIVDTDNKFIIPDDPNYDIPLFYKHSQSKIIEETTIPPTLETKPSKNKTDTVSNFKKKWVTQTEVGTSGNFYMHSSYNNWLSAPYIILKDTSKNQFYPTQYVRDQKKGNDPNNPYPIIQRWAFNEYGDIIMVSNSASEDAALLNSLEGGKPDYKAYFPTTDYQGKIHNDIAYSIELHTNSEIAEGKWKDATEQGNGQGVFKRGKCKISPMDRVVIYMSPRFDSNNMLIQGDSQYLIRAFTGVVNNVQQEYSENRNLITVSGEDVTKYLKISVININPALALSPDQIADQYADQQITVWSNILKGLTTPEIIRLLLFGTDSLRKGEGEALSYKIDGVWLYRLAQSGNDPNLQYNPGYQYDTNTSELIPATDKNGKPLSPTKIRTADYRGMLGKIFTDHYAHIIDPYRPGQPLKGFRPYELSFKTAFSFFQADFKTRRDIAYQCAEDSNFNFYADRYGEIWFHPQRFDVSWILGANNPNVYIIDNPSIISYGFIESDENIYTSIYVTTEPDFGLDSLQTIGYYFNSFRDEPATLKYGQRIFVSSNPIVNTKMKAGYNPNISLEDQPKNMGEPQLSLMVYAKSLLQRILASKYQGQITIGLRAEIDPGRPIYIPIRNMIYFVETVDHDVDFSGRATTTLHLSYGRKPWEMLPELLTYSSKDDVYMTDAHIIDKRSGFLSSANQTLAQTIQQKRKSKGKNTTQPSTVSGNAFDFSSFQNKLGYQESGNDYSKNTGNGAYGRYQFISDTISKIATELKESIPTISQFLADHDMQDRYYLQYAKDLYSAAINTFSAAVGVSITGRSKGLTATINNYGLVAGGWIGGVGHVAQLLGYAEPKGYDAVDANGTYVSDYIALFSYQFRT